LSASGMLTGSPGSVVLVPGLGMAVVLQASRRLVLLSSVVINTQPVNASVLVGFSTAFNVTTSGATTGLSHTWTRDGSVVGNSPSFTYNALVGDDRAVYSIVCTVAHALGQDTSFPAYLTVNVQVWVCRVGPRAALMQSLVLFPCLGLTCLSSLIVVCHGPFA
jgi:hypothetical protein